MSDTERLDWVAKNDQRPKDIYWRMQNECETLREAIDALAVLQKEEWPDDPA